MVEKETASPCSWRAKSWERKSRISIKIYIYIEITSEINRKSSVEEEN